MKRERGFHFSNTNTMNLEGLFGAIYSLLLLILVGIGFFITFHLFRYSPSRHMAIAVTLFFLAGFSALLFLNVIFFFNLPWADLGSLSFFPSIKF